MCSAARLPTRKLKMKRTAVFVRKPKYRSPHKISIGRNVLLVSGLFQNRPLRKPLTAKPFETRNSLLVSSLIESVRIHWRLLSLATLSFATISGTLSRVFGNKMVESSQIMTLVQGFLGGMLIGGAAAMMLLGAGEIMVSH